MSVFKENCPARGWESLDAEEYQRRGPSLVTFGVKLPWGEIRQIDVRPLNRWGSLKTQGNHAQSLSQTQRKQSLESRNGIKADHQARWRLSSVSYGL